MFVESGSFCLCLRRVAFGLIVLVYLPAIVSAATLNVCASGCAYRICNRRLTLRSPATPSCFVPDRRSSEISCCRPRRHPPRRSSRFAPMPRTRRFRARTRLVPEGEPGQTRHGRCWRGIVGAGGPPRACRSCGPLGRASLSAAIHRLRRCRAAWLRNADCCRHGQGRREPTASHRLRSRVCPRACDERAKARDCVERWRGGCAQQLYRRHQGRECRLASHRRLERGRPLPHREQLHRGSPARMSCSAGACRRRPD